MAGEYEAVLTADTSGYTKNVQQALALTQQFTKANEGMAGVVGRMGTAAINKMTEAFGLQSKAMKANVAEAARYQQMLGKVNAQAVAAGKTVGEAEKATKAIARQITGDLGSAVASVSAAQKMGFTGTDQIRDMTKSMVELSAATGDSGSAIAQSLTQITRSFGQSAAPQQISDLGDALTTVTAKFGGSAEEVANFSSQLAPFAKQVGMSQSQLVAFSTAFARQGEGGYRSANVMAKMLTDIDDAVRKGGPALSVYARTMGMTYDEALKFASKDAGGFFITFMDALGKQGPEAVRTLEQLGLEGVRTQRSISALAASPVREMVASAQQSYGTGTTAEAAEEQLGGLTEQTQKLEESLRQVVVASGDPFLGWMEDVTSGATKAADGLAALVSSQPFQLLIGGLALGGIGARAGGTLLSGMYTATSIGGMAGLLGRNVGGAVNPIRQGVDWIGNNRLKVAGIGAAGMTAGMMGMPGGNTLGMLAFLAASGMGGSMFRGAQAGWQFLTADAKHLALTPASRWIAEEGGGRASRLAAYEMAAAGTLAQTGGPIRGRFRQAAIQRLYTPDIDYYERARAGIREAATSENIEKGERQILERSRGYVTPGGRGLLFAEDYQRIHTLTETAKETGQWGKVSSAIKDLEKSMTGPNLIREGAIVGGMPAQTAGARAAFAGRNIATTMGAMAAGFPIQAAGLLANPYALGAVALTSVAGYGLWRNRKEQELQEKYASPEMLGAPINAFREQYGLGQLDFKSLAASTDNLKTAFENLAASFQDQADKFKEGGAYTISPAEYAALTPNKEQQLRFQSFQLGNWGVGGPRTSPAAVAEIATLIGPNPTPESMTAAAEVLKGNKFTAQQAEDIINLAAKQMTGSTEQQLGGLTDWMQERFTKSGIGTLPPPPRPYTPEEQAEVSRQQVTGAKKALGVGSEEIPELQAAAAVLAGSKKSAAGKATDVMDALLAAAEKGNWSPEQLTGAVQWARENFQLSVPENFAFKGGTSFRQQGYQALGRTYGRTPSPTEAALVGGGFIQAPTTVEERIKQEAGMTDVQRAIAYFAQQSSVAKGGPQRPELLFKAPTAPGMDVETATKLQDAAEGLVTFQSQFIKEYKEGNAAQLRQFGQAYLTRLQPVFGTTGTISELQAEQRRYGYETKPGMLAGAGLAEAQRQRETELAGMAQPVQIQAKAMEAIKTITDIQKEQAAGGIIDQQATQDQLNTAMDNLQSATDQYVGYMQTYLKAKRGFDRQMGYMAEDFERQKKYAAQDYATQVKQATAQHQLAMRYQQEDYQRSVMLADRDFKKAMGRAERDYNKQIERMAEEHGIQMERLAKDAAKAAMDPYQRMAVQQTWSMGGIAQNMQEQLRAAQEQLKNLQKLRDAGLSRDAISQLGLNDTKNAMQVQQFVWDMASGGANIGDLNKLAADRIQAAGELFGPDWDENARRSEEDYRRGLDHMAEDRSTWLTDSTNDYQQQMADNEVAFQTAQKRANEQFEIQMRYMAEAYARSLQRMNEANATAVRRAAESFEAQFETMTTDFDKLNAAYQTALNKGIPDWNKIIVSGTANLGTQLKTAFGTMDLTYIDTFSKLAKDRYGADSNLTKMLMALAAAVSGAQGGKGGGTAGGVAPVVPMGFLPDIGGKPIPKGASVYSNALHRTTSINNPYMAPGHYGASKNGPHQGVDLAARGNIPIYSTMNGKVVTAGYGSEGTAGSGYGQYVTVVSHDGSRMIYYGHMSSVAVRKGDTVTNGTNIGRTGATGNVTGEHLHVEERLGVRIADRIAYPYGNTSDPVEWLKEGGIVHRATKAMVGEGGSPEAVIPLNHRGIDVLAKALAKAYDMKKEVVQGGQVMTGNVTYVTTEDHSVNVNGPISVTSDDPDRMGRELERKAKQRALVAPRR